MLFQHAHIVAETLGMSIKLVFKEPVYFGSNCLPATIPCVKLLRELCWAIRSSVLDKNRQSAVLVWLGILRFTTECHRQGQGLLYEVL